MVSKGEMRLPVYHTLQELLADGTRPSRGEGDGLVECINTDYNVRVVSVGCDGVQAHVYASNCVGNMSEYAHVQKLADKGFNCTVWDERRKGKKTIEVRLLDVDPQAMTVDLYPKSFTDQGKVHAWSASLTALGYDVRTRAVPE